MPGAEQLNDPVAYSTFWRFVALALPLLVLTWYAAVTWSTRDRTVSHVPPRVRLWLVRRAHLRELDRIRTAQRDGDLSTRAAHQAVSATVRSFVSEVGDVDARAMNLEQLRASRVPQVATVVELVYPPAFRPQVTEDADERLDQALDGARDLVASWRRS